MFSIKNILVTTDFSDYSAAALDHALSLALEYRSSVFLLHGVEDHLMGRRKSLKNSMKISVDKPNQQNMKEFVQKHVDDYLFIEPFIRHGVPHEQILRFAREKNIDLIVIATHGRTGLNHILMGSIAETIVRLSPVPVLSVKPSAVLEHLITDEDVEHDLHLKRN